MSILTSSNFRLINLLLLLLLFDHDRYLLKYMKWCRFNSRSIIIFQDIQMK